MLTSFRSREAATGYLLISPWFIGFLIFGLGPMVTSLGLSLATYNIITPARYIGLENYAEAFFRDDLFWLSIARTGYFSALYVPICMVGSLVGALLLNQELKGTAFFRTVYFLPSLTPIVAYALLWRWILDPRVGLINYMLAQVGIEGPPWLGSVDWAIPSIVLMASWAGIGGNRMIIFLAGLQGVPKELHEAAELDGASSWQRFWTVTIPMLSPTILFNMIMTMIVSLGVFVSAFMTTKGGPAYASWFYMLHLYENAFNNFNMGYASALAWIFFMAVLVLTFVQLRAAGSWVHYEGALRQ